MDWITDRIAVGNYLEAQDAELLWREAIGSILGLLPQPEGFAPPGAMPFRRIPLIDGAGNDLFTFRLAVDTLAALLAEAPPVLVHCHAGRSRSVVVVAGYLVRHGGMPAEEALAHVTARRQTAVSAALEDLLYEL
jgi:protein-tyrosine phosphatase